MMTRQSENARTFLSLQFLNVANEGVSGPVIEPVLYPAHVALDRLEVTHGRHGLYSGRISEEVDKCDDAIAREAPAQPVPPDEAVLIVARIKVERRRR